VTPDTRIERDAMGEVAVAASALWGAQTQRSLQHFQISSERMPLALLMAMSRVKQAAAQVNAELGLLDQTKADAIARAASEVLQGLHDDAFPLSLWQTGSGTQSHMNVNEVLANRASELLGAGRGDARCVHPNDEVNLGQSSNDVFPTAMHMAALDGLHQTLLPALRALRATLAAQALAVRRHHQGRPHPPARCGAFVPGPGDVGLGGATGPCAWRHRACRRALV